MRRFKKWNKKITDGITDGITDEIKKIITKYYFFQKIFTSIGDILINKEHRRKVTTKIIKNFTNISAEIFFEKLTRDIRIKTTPTIKGIR